MSEGYEIETIEINGLELSGFYSVKSSPSKIQKILFIVRLFCQQRRNQSDYKYRLSHSCPYYENLLFHSISKSEINT